MRKLYVFPGAHKTGTSLLQTALDAASEKFVEADYRIARRMRYYKLGLLKHLRHETIDPDNADELDELRRRFDEVFGEGYEDKDLIISIENLFGEFVTKPYRHVENVLENLGKLFPRHDMTLAFYIRRQDGFLESNYVQSIHKGSTASFDEYMEALGDVNMDWAHVIEPMERILGKKRVSIIPFETIKEGSNTFVKQFFRGFDRVSVSELMPSTKGKLVDTNVSLSDMGLTIARKAYEAIETPKLRMKLAKAMQREFGVDKFDRFRIPSSLRREIAEKYAEPNRQLCEKYGFSEKISETYSFQDILSAEKVN